MGENGCEDQNCSLAPGFQQNCSNQECHWEEPMIGLVELAGIVLMRKPLLHFPVCVTIIYVPLMLFGLLGNILTILVVWLRPYMRSSTYLYLSSLAVSDILILLLLPVDLYKLWRPRPWTFGELSCKLTMFFSECCTFCSILHITFISLERYLAVCWPFTAKTLVTRRRTRTIIGCIWLGAAISAAPVLIMVGVEEVGSEDPGLGGWRESGTWTGKEGEKGFIIRAREREDGDLVLKDVELEDINWKDKEITESSEKNGVTKGFEGGGKSPEVGERAQEEQGLEGRATEDEGPVKREGKRMQNKMKEDEGGGGGGELDRGDGPLGDTRECRCTNYAVSSGLVSAMLVLSNMYFLVPLCVLGLVYSLIGRTLWLRSRNSHRDLNNRHTVKMLGVIVLVFVLCWLPFHVGRTIFFFTLDSDKHVGNASHALPEAYGHANVGSRMESERGSERDDRVFTDLHAEALQRHLSPGTETLSDAQSDEPSSTDTRAWTPADPHAPHDDAPFSTTQTDSQYFLYYLSQYFNLASSVLFYLSAAINPLLYNLMSERYRHAVHSLVRKHTRTQTHRLHTLAPPHSTTTV